MTPSDLRTLLDYHYWARDRVLAAVEPLTTDQFRAEMGGSFGSIRDTLAHTYSAEFVWLSRWERKPHGTMISAELFPDASSLRAAWKELESRMREFFGGLDQGGIDQSISYKNFAGQESTSVLWHMLQHVVNHASYHRGQVTTLLRQIGATPPKGMDLIAYYRDIPSS